MDIEFIRKFKELEETVYNTKCTCDTEHPWHYCKRCLIAKELNEVYSVVRQAYSDYIIENKEKEQ